MSFPRNTAVCFTGHRSFGSDSASDLFDMVLAHLYAYHTRGYRTFIAGGAVGFDMLAAQAVCEMRLERPDTRLVLALPFPGHDSRFPDGDKRQLAELIAFADEVITVSDHYHPGVFAVRNRWMVDHAHACLCYLRQTGRSGTRQTMDMARTAGLEMTIA